MRLGALGPPHDPGPTREQIRNRQVEEARRVGWPRLDREDLDFGRYGIVEHKATGSFYRLHRGELTDSVYSGAVAYFEDNSGIRFLEPPSGFPSNRAELEQLRAAREQRRNAPRPRRQVARR